MDSQFVENVLCSLEYSRLQNRVVVQILVVVDQALVLLVSECHKVVDKPLSSQALRSHTSPFHNHLAAHHL